MNCFRIEKQLKNNYCRIVFQFLDALETKLNEFVSLNLCNLLIIIRIEKQFERNCFVFVFGIVLFLFLELFCKGNGKCESM